MVTFVCMVAMHICAENIIFEDHGLHNYVYRSTVQMLMSIVDADGAKRRRRKRLVRRTYQNKVQQLHKIIINS